MHRYILVVIITVFFISCKKDASDEFSVDSTNPLNDTAWKTSILADAPVNKIFETLSIPSQSSSFDSKTGHTVNFNGYLQIKFPENSCQGNGGEKISGTVKIEVDYLKTRGDMIRFKKSTTSYDRILESGGAFNIKLMQNGKQLKIAPQKFFTIRYHNSKAEPHMTVFYGDTTINNPDNFTWVPATDMQRVSFWHDAGGGGYEMSCKKFNWINCDKFVETPNPRTAVSAILPVNFTNNNTVVYLVFEDMLSVLRMYVNFPNRLFYFNNVPINSDVILVSISKIGDNFYLGTKETRVTKNLVVRLSPEKKTQKDINDYIDSL